MWKTLCCARADDLTARIVRGSSLTASELIRKVARECTSWPPSEASRPLEAFLYAYARSAASFSDETIVSAYWSRLSVSMMTEDWSEVAALAQRRLEDLGHRDDGLQGASDFVLSHSMTDLMSPPLFECIDPIF